jgi:hypothetical protein
VRRVRRVRWRSREQRLQSVHGIVAQPELEGRVGHERQRASRFAGLLGVAPPLADARSAPILDSGEERK